MLKGEQDSHTDGGDRSDNLTKLELVQDRRLSSSVKTDHEDAGLLGAAKEGKPAAHCCDKV